MTRLLPILAGAALCLLSIAGPVKADESVVVFEVAAENPVEDVEPPIVVAVGASVPPRVDIATIPESDVYGFIYVNGSPIVVDLNTRSIVRVN